MTPGFRNLLNRYAMIAFERQRTLAEALGGDPEWSLSPKNGTATLNGKVYRAQFLGSRADESNTWRWAWAAEKGALPAEVLDAAKKVKAVGKKRAIAELAEEQFPLEPLELDAHTMALVATSVAEMPAYYRFPYAGGVLFAALDIPDFELPEADPARIAEVVQQVVERLDVEHRTAFVAYLEARGAKTEGKGNITARWPDGRTLTAEFDAAGKLVGLQVPPAAGARKGAGLPTTGVRT